MNYIFYTFYTFIPFKPSVPARQLRQLASGCRPAATQPPAGIALYFIPVRRTPLLPPDWRSTCRTALYTLYRMRRRGGPSEDHPPSAGGGLAREPWACARIGAQRLQLYFIPSGPGQCKRSAAWPAAGQAGATGVGAGQAGATGPALPGLYFIPGRATHGLRCWH